jgi:hypothetical protein
MSAFFKARLASVIALCTLLSLAAVAHAGHSLRVTILGTKGRVKSSTPVKLDAKAHWRGPKAELSYHWSTVTGPALPSVADRHSKTLVIPPGELDAGAQYHLRLKITANYKDEDDNLQTVTATSDVKLAVNARPTGGSCTMKLRWVGQRGASFVIAAPGWVDEDDKRIQYRYSIIRNGKRHVLKNWSGATRHQNQSVAKPGDVLVARCDVRDALGDMATAESDKHERD